MNRADRSFPVTTTVVTTVELSIAAAAWWFAGLSDDDQAQFIIEVGRIAEGWTGALGAGGQWFNIGSHLRNCECSTPSARNIVEQMYNGLQNGTHK